MKREHKKKLTTTPYRGVRDFYPEDMFVENYVLDTMAVVAKNFGYEEYSASILEPSELYEGKSSEEIVREQTYTFEDRGGRRITLRPEMTPSVARMVAARRREFSYPLRLYSIPNIFRYERPQRGRLREHWQLNVDLFGVPSIEGDVEVIQVAYHIMEAFGASSESFEMRIGSRSALEEEFERRTIPITDRKKISALIDRKGKMPEEERVQELETLRGNFIITESDDLKEIRNRLKTLGVNNVVFDPDIVRGFEYYTGIVFEVFDTGPHNNRSLFGGGRYDNLLDAFGEHAPAVGFGMGDVTIRDFLETYDLLPPYKPSTQLYICTIGEKAHYATRALANSLHSQGVNVAIDFSDRKIGDQIKVADKKSIPYVLCVGDEEQKTNMYMVKNLKTGKEVRCAADEIANIVKESKE